ncbi:XrtA/PEP-CTERM system TPR-repeat protein PrsT [Paraglaciecola sp.]|uniref:XrtA/PEP-CTERM system TPR-repeat protein PrsT n=1 Tax=Paraglaciecola sp. TaxID=1920173 RepID=UPI0030F3F711
MRLLHLFTITTIFILILSGCEQKSFDELIQSAEIKISNKQFDSAIIDLKNAVNNTPQNAKARFELGRVYLLKSDYSDAEKELVKANELGYPQYETEPLILKAVFYQNDFGRVLIRSEALKDEQLKSDSKINLYTYLSKIKSNVDSTSRSLPEDVLVGDDLLIARSYSEFAAGNIEESLQIANLFQNSNDEILEKNILVGLIYAQLKRYDDAIKSFELAISIAPNYYFSYFKLAEIQILANQLENAEQLINQLLTLNPNNSYSNFLMAQVNFKQEKFPQAFSNAEKATQNGIDNTYSNLIAGISAYKVNRFETSYRHLSKIVNVLPKNHVGRTILIDVKLRLGYTNEALELINDFYAEPEIMASIYSEVAKQSFTQGDISQAKEFFNKSTTLNPENTDSLLQQGLVQLSDNDFSGIETLQKVIEKSPNTEQAWMLLAQAYMQNSEVEKALSTAREYQNINPANGLSLEAYIYLQLDMPDKALPLLTKSLELDSNLVSSKRFLMLLYAKNKNFEEAAKLGENIIISHPENLEYLIEFMNVMIDKNQEKDLENFLKKQIKNFDSEKSVGLNIALALLYQHQGQLKEAVGLLKPLEKSQDIRIHFTLGNIYMLSKQYANAAKSFNSIVTTNNKLINAWIQLIEALSNAEQYQLALEKSKEALAIFPKNSVLEFKNTRLLLKNKFLDEARKHIKALKIENQDNPNIKLLNGELALMEQKYDSATRDLSTFYQSSPSFEVAKLLAIAYQELHRPAEGAVYLEQELLKIPSRFKETHYVAEYLANNGLFEESAKHYESILSAFPEQFITLNNYANVLINMGEYQRAYDLATKSLQLNATSPFALDTVGWSLFKQGKPIESLVYIKKANEILPTNIEIQFHLIENYIELKDTNNANILLKRTTAKSPIEKQLYERLKSML